MTAVPRCLAVGGSDSGGGAGIQADLKAFAAAGCHGSTAIAVLTAQNTVAVDALHPVPVDFLRAQLDAIASDIGFDAAKTGMLFSEELIEVVAAFFADHGGPLIVDPVIVASSGRRLLEPDGLAALKRSLLPLATVVTPNLVEAQALTGSTSSPHELAERIHSLGAAAVIITGGHGDDAADHLYDGSAHTALPWPRSDARATHGTGCTHSATLCALLAKGLSVADAAQEASLRTAQAVAHGLADIGAGEGPVDILDIRARGASVTRGRRSS